jgi:hypothetical protein
MDGQRTGNEIELVFKILEKEFLVKRDELNGELRDPFTILSLLERYSPLETAEIIADEVRFK